MEHTDAVSPGAAEVRLKCNMAFQILRVLHQAAASNPELRLVDAMLAINLSTEDPTQQGLPWGPAPYDSFDGSISSSSVRSSGLDQSYSRNDNGFGGVRSRSHFVLPVSSSF